jgi:hypothetical protein
VKERLIILRKTMYNFYMAKTFSKVNRLNDKKKKLLLLQKCLSFHKLKPEKYRKNPIE